MVLHREGLPINQFDALDDSVVGAGVTDDRGAERGVERLAGLALEREPVILRGHRDPSGGVVDDGHVDPAVTEDHLVCRASQSAAEDLVAEADTEQRDPFAEDFACHPDDVVGGRGVTGPIGQEDTVGFEFGDLLEGGRRRQDVAADAAAGEVARGVGLDTEIDRRDGEALRSIGFDDVRGVGADLACEVRTQHRRLITDPAEQLVDVGKGIPGEHTGLHRPRLRRCRTTARVSIPAIPTIP